jgi:hypothetical protein
MNLDKALSHRRSSQGNAAKRQSFGRRGACVADASMTAMIDAFRRALLAYDGSVDTVGPQEAAARFTAEIEEIIRGRAFGRAIETSLQKGKGMHPFDFWRR